MQYYRLTVLELPYFRGTYVNVHSKHWSRVFFINEVDAKGLWKAELPILSEYCSAVWVISWRTLEGEGEGFGNDKWICSGSTEVFRRHQCLIVVYAESTELQWPLSDGKSGQAGEVGGALPSPFTLYTVLSRTKLCCTLQLRGQIHSPYFYSTPLCTLWLYLHKPATP